jgi:predicted dinucleotide-binding enzyme
MSYAIIGFGKIGQALAKAFARNGAGSWDIALNVDIG